MFIKEKELDRGFDLRFQWELFVQLDNFECSERDCFLGFEYFVEHSKNILLEFPFESLVVWDVQRLTWADLEWGIEFWIYPLVICSGISQSILGMGEIAAISSFVVEPSARPKKLK